MHYKFPTFLLVAAFMVQSIWFSVPTAVLAESQNLPRLPNNLGLMVEGLLSEEVLSIIVRYPNDDKGFVFELDRAAIPDLRELEEMEDAEVRQVASDAVLFDGYVQGLEDRFGEVVAPLSTFVELEIGIETGEFALGLTVHALDTLVHLLNAHFARVPYNLSAQQVAAAWPLTLNSNIHSPTIEYAVFAAIGVFVVATGFVASVITTELLVCEGIAQGLPAKDIFLGATAGQAIDDVTWILSWFGLCKAAGNPWIPADDPEPPLTPRQLADVELTVIAERLFGSDCWAARSGNDYRSLQECIERE